MLTLYQKTNKQTKQLYVLTFEDLLLKIILYKYGM